MENTGKLKYEIVTCREKTVLGVSGRTGNEDPDCGKIIGGLWEQFLGQGIYPSIDNKENEYPIGLYSDYDAASYDVTVGVSVTEVPADTKLTKKVIPAGRFAVFTIEGDVVNDVAEAWNAIWQMPLERSFAGDYEEYLSNDMQHGLIKIYIALQ